MILHADVYALCGYTTNGVAPSPTPWCSSYWKGSHQITLDNGDQLYFCKTFPKVIYPKLNVIAQLEFKLAYYNSAIQCYNYYTMRTIPPMCQCTIYHDTNNISRYLSWIELLGSYEIYSAKWLTPKYSENFNSRNYIQICIPPRDSSNDIKLLRKVILHVRY